MKKYVADLQSLRGFAALVVLLRHCTNYYIYPHKVWTERLLNAHAAVVLFFVLSGYVLSLSLNKERISGKSALRFYVRRIFRIYPALFAVCAFAFVALLFVHGRQSPPTVAPGWLDEIRDRDISVAKTIAAFFGVGTSLPVPLWTLFVELVGSLLMPGIVFVFARGRRAAFLLTGFLLAFSLIYGQHTRLWVGEYLVDFALGASITMIAPVFLWLGATPSRARISALTSCAVLAFGRLLGPWDFTNHYHAPIPSTIEAFSAMCLIGTIVLGTTHFPILRHRLSIFLGDISYSLYLLHASVLVFVAGFGQEVFKIPLFTTNATLATLSLAFFTLLITIPLATLSYRYIELPGIELGKRVLNWQRFKGESAALVSR